MSVEIINGEKGLNLPWSVCDEVFGLFAELGLPEPEDQFDATPWAADAHRLLKEALEQGSLRMRRQNVDSMGREFVESWESFSVNGPEPLPQSMREFAEKILAFLEP